MSCGLILSKLGAIEVAHCFNIQFEKLKIVLLSDSVYTINRIVIQKYCDASRYPYMSETSITS